jgi:hypothetical protein
MSKPLPNAAGKEHGQYGSERQVHVREVVRKAAERKYLLAINRNRRRGVQIGINTRLSK